MLRFKIDVNSFIGIIGTAIISVIFLSIIQRLICDGNAIKSRNKWNLPQLLALILNPFLSFKIKVCQIEILIFATPYPQRNHEAIEIVTNV